MYLPDQRSIGLQPFWAYRGWQTVMVVDFYAIQVRLSVCPSYVSYWNEYDTFIRTYDDETAAAAVTLRRDGARKSFDYPAARRLLSFVVGSSFST